MTNTGLRPRDGENPVGLQKLSHIERPWRIGFDIEPSHEPPPYPTMALGPIVPTDLSSANHPAHQIKHQSDEPLEHRSEENAGSNQSSWRRIDLQDDARSCQIASIDRITP
jgi:hypothetical protein